MKYLLIIFIIGNFSFFGCGKSDNNCHDIVMERNHIGICSQHCPGVCGCDGITYCNTCVANSKGITIILETPCK